KEAATPIPAPAHMYPIWRVLGVHKKLSPSAPAAPTFKPMRPATEVGSLASPKSRSARGAIAQERTDGGPPERTAAHEQRSLRFGFEVVTPEVAAHGADGGA